MNTELYTNETLKTSNSALHSAGNNVFETISSGVTVALDGSSPSNNYAGTSIKIFLFGMKLNTYIYRRIEKITVTAKMQTGYNDGFIYVSAFEQNYKAGVSLPICPESAVGVIDRQTGDITVTISGETNGALAQECMKHDLILCGRGTVIFDTIAVSVTYASPYSISDIGETPSNGATENSNSKITFAWQIVSKFYPNNPAVNDRTDIAQSFTYSWKSESGDITTKNIASSDQTIEIPAGEFANNSKIEWKVTGEMEHGVPINPYPVEPLANPDHKGWFVLFLVEMDGDANATIVSPKNISVNGSAQIDFVWEHYNATGTAQTRADLQTGTTPDQLTDFATIQGAANTYSAPANSFTAGDLYWRVRTYNADGIAGEWSETAHIIVIAASSAPLISLERISPRPIIRWETNGQVAFEIEIVGIATNVSYGAENRYVAKTVLPDGRYTVRVRVQNKYALWSPWAEAALSIVNSQGGAISLSATASKTGEVQLSWSTTGTFTSYQILRNGAVIGETTERSYLDRLAIGACSYQIRGIVDSAGNYSLSGVQALTVTVPTVKIALVSGGDWLALPYTTTDIREVSVSTSKSVTYQQFLGSSLPVGVVGEALSKTVQMSCAFPYRLQADAAKLEALIGQLVCVKDPRGRRYLGILGSMSQVSSRFYLSYSLTITPVTCEEVEL